MEESLDQNNNLKKITELTFKKKTTREVLDLNGNRVQQRLVKDIKRKVKVVSGGKRFAHFFIDLIVFQIIYEFFMICYSLVVNQMEMDMGTILIASFNISTFFMLLYPLYYFVFEFYLQKTPGKYITKCRVVNEYGNKLSIENALIRSIIRLVPFESFSCLSDRGWHDSWSNTYLISEEEYKKLKKLQAEQSK